MVPFQSGAIISLNLRLDQTAPPPLHTQIERGPFHVLFLEQGLPDATLKHKNEARSGSRVYVSCSSEIPGPFKSRMLSLTEYRDHLFLKGE